jgi:hypothetical protein
MSEAATTIVSDLRELFRAFGAGEIDVNNPDDQDRVADFVTRISKATPASWHDCLAQLNLACELGLSLERLRPEQLTEADLKHYGGAILRSALHVAEFIQAETGCTLNGADIPANRKN